MNLGIISDYDSRSEDKHKPLMNYLPNTIAFTLKGEKKWKDLKCFVSHGKSEK